MIFMSFKEIHSSSWVHATMAGLAQSIERLTAEQEVTGSFPGARLILKYLRNEDTSFALQAARPSHD